MSQSGEGEHCSDCVCIRRVALLEATSAAHEARLNKHDAELIGLAQRLDRMEASAEERDRRQTTILERILDELLAVRAAVKRGGKKKE